MGWKFEREQEAWRFIRDARVMLAKLAEMYYPQARAEVKKLCARRHIPYEEVQGSEHDGFMRAVNNFDPERGTPFEAFLKLHLRGATLDFARANERRPCRHGDKPRFELGPLGEVGEAELGEDDACSLMEIEELLRRVVDQLSTPLRRNLFVLCAVIGRPITDVAYQIGVECDAAEHELEKVMHEAANVVKSMGLAPEAFMNANPSMYQLRKKSGVRLIADDDLIRAGAAALTASREKSPMADPDARTLVGTCSQCGAEVLGPKGIHGPIPVTCACGERVDVS